MNDIREMKCSIDELVKTGKIKVAADMNEGLYSRIKDIEFNAIEYRNMEPLIKTVGVTDELKKVVNTFRTKGGTPAGFRRELVLGGADNSLRIDLKRDIAFQENGIRRPGNVLYSANTADPDEVAAMKNFIASLTTNPQIIYSGFLENSKVNKNRKFKNRFEVLAELKELVGPGVDISVELNNPFADESEIIEEIAKFEEVIPKYQLVIKVPHTGPLNSENVQAFLKGQYPAYDKGRSRDFFYGHNLAFKLQNMGYRVNFTLMAEPHQAALALLARPYFINAFVERRNNQTQNLKAMLKNLDETKDQIYKEEIHNFMMKSDMLASNDDDIEGAVIKARMLLEYRLEDEKGDGLDSVRQSLRVLKTANLPETRLIVCNMRSTKMYTDLDKLAVEPEFADMKQKIVVTREPEYFAQFTASPTVFCYQRASLTSAELLRETFNKKKN